MDAAPGTSSGTQNKGRKSRKAEEIARIFDLYHGVNLTPSKIPDVVEAFSGSSDDDLEADEPENDVLYEVSSSDEDISSESEDESDEEAPAPPREKFESVYIPKKELSLDEGTMAWRGRLSFKVYNPNKPDKYGVKFYMLAEGKSGYIYKFDVYCGIGKTTVETVMGLMAPLVNKGYHLYMDHYYNSVSLTEQLREVGVYTCGTLRLQRGAPKDLQQVVKGKMATDTTVYMRKDNTFVIVWKDKRPVSVITNIHNADTTQAQRRKRVRKGDGRTGVEIVKMNKPKAIADYNKFMKGI
ncbi:piggyBac transposable element-derived protein 4-like [Procambarus clarkii]|uniref:piggyBac transposable element-derived protein 4-like n=1 Tax=Procambarus clarkii TaxID=6728 RepID=UPI003742971F